VPRSPSRLGTDGASTNDNLDMHEVMRLAVMLQRPGEPDRSRWPPPSMDCAWRRYPRARRCVAQGWACSKWGAGRSWVRASRGAAWIPLNVP